MEYLPMTMPSSIAFAADTILITEPNDDATLKWLAGWCLCFTRPLSQGALAPDPWLWLSGPAADASPSEGALFLAYGLAGRNMLTVQDDWITRVRGRAPLYLSRSSLNGDHSLRLDLSDELAALPWVRDHLETHLKLLRYLKPQLEIRTTSEALHDALATASGKDLLEGAQQVITWRLNRYRKSLWNAPDPSALSRDCAWIDESIHAIMAQESRQGLLAKEHSRSWFEGELELLHAAPRTPSRMRCMTSFILGHQGDK